jgi:hypothetical protein
MFLSIFVDIYSWLIVFVSGMCFWGFVSGGWSIDENSGFMALLAGCNFDKMC